MWEIAPADAAERGLVSILVGVYHRSEDGVSSDKGAADARRIRFKAEMIFSSETVLLRVKKLTRRLESWQ